MARLLRALSALILLCGAAAAASRQAKPPPVDLEYEIRPSDDAGRPALRVIVRFRGAADGQTRLRLPWRWGPEPDFLPGIKRLVVLTPGARLEAGDRPSARVVRHRPSETVALSYDVVSFQPAQGHRRHRPVIERDRFHFVGHGVFAFPSRLYEARARVRMRWEAFPPGWTIANSRGAGVRHQEFAATGYELQHAVYVGGDYRLRFFDVDGRPAAVALRGKWRFSDRALARTLARLLKAQRDFWADHDFPFFFVAQSPSPEGDPGGGTALTDSVTVSVPRESGLDALTRLYAHEFFHEWNGVRMDGDGDSRRLDWFTEGFTDYYARLLNLRAGLLTFEEYVDEFNYALYRSVVAPEAERLSYRRGDALAHNWDALIRARTGGRRSLDDVMRDVLRTARADGWVLTGRTVAETADAHAFAGFAREVLRRVDAGERVSPDPGALGPCARLEPLETGEYDPDLDDRRMRPGRTVERVEPAGEAYRAGLRPGQLILEWRGSRGRPWLPVEAKISDESGERWLTFRPVSGRKVTVPFFRVDEEAYRRDPEACLERFSAT